jgi:hypothetical protein
MLRFLLLSILPLLIFVPNTIAADVSQFLLSFNPPFSEEFLNGDVELVIFSVEYAEQETVTAEYAEQETGEQNNTIWMRVHLDDTVTQPPNVTFLVPQSILRQNPKPYYRTTSSMGEKFTCFLMPPGKSERGLVSVGSFIVWKYDSRGRIRDMNYLDVTWNSTGFRYVFEYGDEDGGCQAVRLFFRKDDRYVHEGKEIAPGEEDEICLIEFQYENNRLKKYFSNDSNYFFSPEKTEMTYDEHGFLASKAVFDGTDAQEPECTWYYRNYEQDHFGNWTHRDVYYNEQRIGTYHRKIYYTGDTLPDFIEDLTNTESVELESGSEWKMDFPTSIFWLLSCASKFCSYEYLSGK